MPDDSAKLCVAASGPEPIFYQWYQGAKGDTANPVDGAILRCYEAKNLTATVSYWVRVSNPAGAVDSEIATVTVSTPPVISGQPQPATRVVGSTLVLRVEATGTEPLTFQWFRGAQPIADDARISGATGATLTITGLTLTDTGEYSVVVQNNGGSTPSAKAAVTVVPVEEFRSEINTPENGTPELQWSVGAKLQTAASISGPWEDVPGATSPFPLVPGFFRLVAE